MILKEKYLNDISPREWVGRCKNWARVIFWVSLTLQPWFWHLFRVHWWDWDPLSSETQIHKVSMKLSGLVSLQAHHMRIWLPLVPKVLSWKQASNEFHSGPHISIVESGRSDQRQLEVPLWQEKETQILPEKQTDRSIVSLSHAGMIPLKGYVWNILQLLANKINTQGAFCPKTMGVQRWPVCG